MSTTNVRTELAMKAHVARIQKMKETNTPVSGNKYAPNMLNGNASNSSSSPLVFQQGGGGYNSTASSSLNTSGISDTLFRDKENNNSAVGKDTLSNDSIYSNTTVPMTTAFFPSSSSTPSSLSSSTVLPISLSPTHTLNSVASQAEAELHRLRTMIAASQNQRAKLVAAAVAEVEAIKENSLATTTNSGPSSSSTTASPTSSSIHTNNTGKQSSPRSVEGTNITPSKVSTVASGSTVLSPVSSTIQSLITGITIPTFSPSSSSSPYQGNTTTEHDAGQFSPMRINSSQSLHSVNKPLVTPSSSTPPSTMRPFPVDVPPPPPSQAPILHSSSASSSTQRPASTHSGTSSARRTTVHNLDLIESSDDNQMVTLTKRELRIKISEAVASATEEAFEAAREQNNENIREMLQSAESEKTYAISDAETKAQMTIAAIQERMAGLEAVRQARAQARERDLRTLVNQAEEKAVAKEKQLRSSIDTANERAREAVANSRKAEREVTQLKEEFASSEAHRQSLVTENDSLKQLVSELQRQLVSLQHTNTKSVSDTEEKNRLNEMMKYYEHQVQELRGKLQEANQARATAETRTQEMEIHHSNQLRDIKAEIEINRNTIQVLNEEVEEAHAQQRRLEANVEERDATISTFELQIANSTVTNHHRSTHNTTTYSESNSTGSGNRVGFLSPPEVQALKDNHARELAIAADKAESEKRRAILEAINQAEAKAAAEKNSIMATARDTALAESERTRVDAVRNALAEASNGFKQQLSTALSTLRTQLDKERQTEVEARVAEARMEYEGIVSGWEAQNESWRKETMNACERSLEMARQQVTEARTAASRSEVRILGLMADIGKYRDALVSMGHDPDSVASIGGSGGSPRVHSSTKVKSTPSTNRSNRSSHPSPHIASPPPKYSSSDMNENDTNENMESLPDTRDELSSVDGGLGPLGPESMTEDDFIRMNDEFQQNSMDQPTTTGIPSSRGMVPPEPSMDNDSHSIDSNSMNGDQYYGPGSETRSTTSSTASSINLDAAPLCPPGVPQRLYETILTLPVSSLRNLLDKAGINNRDCVEKTELQDRLLKAVEKGQGMSTGIQSNVTGDNTSNSMLYQDDNASSRSVSVTSTTSDRTDNYADYATEDGITKKHSMKKVPSPAELKNWLPAQAEDGSIYYYHRVTRAVRWDRPDANLARRMEERIRDEAAAVKTRQQDRLAAMAAEEEAKAAEAVLKNKVEAEVDARVKAWSKNKTIRTMLSTLSSVLHYIKRPLPADIATTATTGSNDDIKKAYLRAVRVVHPDKMSGGTLEAQVEAQRVFSVLSEAYTRFTNGDDSPYVSAYSGHTYARGSSQHTRHGVPPPGVPSNPYSNRMYPGVNTSNAMAAAAARARAAMANMQAARNNLPQGFPTNPTNNGGSSSSSSRYAYANNAPYGFGRPGK